MDKQIKKYPFIEFDEMNLCLETGIMYQRDTSVSVAYDKHYFEHYVRLENTEIAKKLNDGRTALTEKYCDTLLDIGVGSGEFIKSSSILVYGYDINPLGIKWLRENGLYKDPYAAMPEVDGLSFWDTLEHIPRPTDLLGKVTKDMYVFISIPIFSDLVQAKKSKHYKPNEHYYYFTPQGMVKYMTDLGFKAVEVTDFETRAGRDSILTFVFKKA
jgi:hypothetical protein